MKRELREVISTVAEYEPVRLFVPQGLTAEARHQNFGSNVEIVPAPVDDIWMRDILPTFALRDGAPIAIDWNFNSWGTSPLRAARPGDRLAGLMAIRLGLPLIHAPFITEGGAFVTDGDGTVIATKSCLLNKNRNPGFGRDQSEQMEQIERGFSTVGGRKVIWLDLRASYQAVERRKPAHLHLPGHVPVSGHTGPGSESEQQGSPGGDG